MLLGPIGSLLVIKLLKSVSNIIPVPVSPELFFQKLQVGIAETIIADSFLEMVIFDLGRNDRVLPIVGPSLYEITKNCQSDFYILSQ